MPKLGSMDDLLRAGEAARSEIEVRRGAGVTIYVGMGTCGIAAGARDVLTALKAELARQQIVAEIEGVGCIGICVKEPLVDIQQGNQPRVTYGNVTPDMVPRIIEEHLIQGAPVKKWVIGRVPGNY